MRLGRLNNGNPPGDPNAAPRCGAATRCGHPCQGPAMANGRCRMHGGTATGPRTAEGRQRIAKARTSTGMHTAGMRELREELALLRRIAKAATEAT